jgi:hypothetical protein
VHVFVPAAWNGCAHRPAKEAYPGDGQGEGPRKRRFTSIKEMPRENRLAGTWPGQMQNAVRDAAKRSRGVMPRDRRVSLPSTPL